MSTVIDVSNIGKLYKLGRVGTGTLSHDLRRWWYRMRGFEDPYFKIGDENDRSKKTSSEYTWAVRDLNFQVRQGELLGIIGRNGAGKSTLLKILSRTTSPSVGTVKIKGRIASLLEVGTGFHPELTGRENVFLNGAILGMTNQEIRAKFDEIVDFSGVEKYIDTPVKRYSSGMYVRLAFGVAAHLESEILIIDEVLAVGDGEFQKKCLGKMKDVSRTEGRTVLFVSHDLQAINSLTTDSIFLNNGRLISKGRTSEIIDTYLSYGTTAKTSAYFNTVQQRTSFQKIELVTTNANSTQINGDSLQIIVEVYCKQPLNNGAIAIQIFNSQEIPVVHFWLFNSEFPVFNSPGIHKLKCTIQKCRLFFGKYTLTAYLSENSGRSLIEQIDRVCPFEVVMFKSTRDHPWQEGSSTYVEDFSWEIVQ